MARWRRVDRDLREERERKYRLRAKTVRFIPDGDSDFARMARNFANHVAEHAERFRIPAEQVEKLLNAVEEYRLALTRTMRHDSAGPRATSIKNDARKELENIVRAVARTVRACESLTDVDRMNLNLTERPERLKQRSCPQIAPVLTFVGATHGMNAPSGRPLHILEYRNDFDRSSGAKPHGATRMELFVELVPVGAKVPAHPGEMGGGVLWYLRSYSTSRFEVEFPVLKDGTPMLVVYWGRWADARGAVGPFSQTCVARVEGGGLPELLYIGTARPALSAGASVSRKVEHRQFSMLEGPPERALEMKVMPSLEHARLRADTVPLLDPT